MLCPRRSDLGGEAASGHDSPFNYPREDHWEVRPNGDRTCSYCGSLHEDDFIDIIQKYVDGVEGYRVDTMVDKSYKVYANRPGVINASGGGIKFYKYHVDQAHPDIEKRQILFQKADKKCRLDFAARYPMPKPVPLTDDQLEAKRVWVIVESVKQALDATPGSKMDDPKTANSCLARAWHLIKPELAKWEESIR